MRKKWIFIGAAFALAMTLTGYRYNAAASIPQQSYAALCKYEIRRSQLNRLFCHNGFQQEFPVLFSYLPHLRSHKKQKQS